MAAAPYSSPFCLPQTLQCSFTLYKSGKRYGPRMIFQAAHVYKEVTGRSALSRDARSSLPRLVSRIALVKLTLDRRDIKVPFQDFPLSERRYSKRRLIPDCGRPTPSALAADAERAVLGSCILLGPAWAARARRAPRGERQRRAVFNAADKSVGDSKADHGPPSKRQKRGAAHNTTLNRRPSLSVMNTRAELA